MGAVLLAFIWHGFLQASWICGLGIWRISQPLLFQMFILFLYIFLLLLIFSLSVCYTCYTCPTILGFSVLFFFAVIVLFAFQYSRTQYILQLRDPFLTQVQSSNKSIKGILHLLHCNLAFLFLLLRISNSLLTLPICSYMLLLFSMEPLAQL